MRSSIQHCSKKPFALTSILPSLLGLIVSLCLSINGNAQTPFTQSNTLAVVVASTESLDSLAGVTPDQQKLFSSLKQFTGGKKVQVYFDLLPSSIAESRIYLAAPEAAKQQEIESKLKSFGIVSIDKQDGYWLLNRYGGKSKPTQAASRTEIELALKSVDDSDIQVAFALPGHVQRALIENYESIEESWGGGSAQQWASAFKSMSIGLWLKNSKLKIVFQVQDSTAAKSAAARLPIVLTKLAPMVEQKFGEAMSNLVLKAAKAQPRISSSQIEIELAMDQGGSLASIIAETFMGELPRSTKMNHMRQIGLAIHNFYSAYQCLPPSAKQRDASGKPKLSWRVHILPYLGTEGEELYKQFHLDEAWDSPHNKALLVKMPEVFSDTNLSAGFGNLISNQAGYTVFLAPVGKGTIFGGNEVVTFNRVQDGTSNTAMLVEVAASKAVPWTAPDDYQFDPQSPMSGLNIDRQGNFLVLFGDGSVRALNKSIGNEMLINLFDMNDGKVIDLDPK